MLNTVKITAAWFVLFSLCFAQQLAGKDIELRIKIFSPDQKTQLTLNAAADYDEPVEGYFLQSKYDDLLQGEIRKGGFSFLIDKVFGEPVNMLKDRWAKNDFPAGDLANLSNGVNVSKIFTFHILGLVKNPEDDTVSIFFKYTIYELQRGKEEKPDIGQMNLGFNVKLGYKLLRIPFGYDIPVDFTEGIFGKDKIIFNASKMQDASGILTLPDNNTLFDQVKRSAQSSSLNLLKCNFSVEFIQADIDMKPSFGFTQFDKFFIHDRIHNLKSFTSLRNQETGEICKLSVPVYYAHLSFPFILYNKEKAELYKNYRSKDKVFSSDYNVIIVPVESKEDTLIADIFISYSKLNIDQMQRWTPIKKRLKIINTFGVNIDMPKENWTAAFKKDGDQYQIYGYSDFERYINEYLYINFE